MTTTVFSLRPSTSFLDPSTFILPVTSAPLRAEPSTGYRLQCDNRRPTLPSFSRLWLEPPSPTPEFTHSIPLGHIEKLPRGGMMVMTSKGWLQFGTPMWTNKDSFSRFVASGGFDKPKSTIPFLIATTYVIDTDYVPESVGLLSLDFLQYMYYVTKGTTFHLIAPDQKIFGLAKKFLDISYRCPEDLLSADEEYPQNAFGKANLKDEVTRGFDAAHADTLRQLHALNDAQITLESGIRIKKNGRMTYEVIDEGRTYSIDLNDHPIPISETTRDLSVEIGFKSIRDQLLIEGRPALLPLGTGHGFVPNEHTSGFMVWNGGKVTLVDPPSNTIDYFLTHGLPLEAIEGVIISHGHTDHHGDAIPKLIRLLPKIRIYTTPTIYHVLQKQYELALGSEREGPIQWNFIPLLPQHFTEINGLWFRSDYAFHVTPTIGFEIWTEPNMKTGYPAVYFSGDTYADPIEIWALTKKAPDGGAPVLSEARARQIIRHQDIIMGSRNNTRPASWVLIEAGIPPIHTPTSSTRGIIEYANAMGVDTSRVLAYHIAQSAADAAGIKKWQVGPQGFLDLSDHFPARKAGTLYEYARQVLNRLPLLDSMPREMRDHLLQQGTLLEYPSGQELIKEGEEGKEFYILIEGEVEITRSGERIAVRPTGILGEGALLNDRRNASITTTAPSRFIKIDVAQLTPYITRWMGTGLKHLREVRLQAREALNQSRFKTLAPSVQDLIFLHGNLENYEVGHRLIEQGSNDKDVYLILEGDVAVSIDGQNINQYTVGKILGEIALVNNSPRGATVTALNTVKVLKLDSGHLKRMMGDYPGVAVALMRNAASWPANR